MIPEGLRPWLRLVLVAALFVVGVAGLIAAVEGDKEVWALCGNVREGQPRARLVAMLGTATFLRVREGGEGEEETVRFDTPYTLGASSCTITLQGDVVGGKAFREVVAVRAVAAGVALPVLAALVVLQLLLAAGRPLGHLAWGGRHRRLPRGLRLGSALSAVVLAGGALLAAERAGWVEWVGRPGVVEVGVALLALLFMLSLAGNALSASAGERRWGIPAAYLLALAFLALTLSR